MSRRVNKRDPCTSHDPCVFRVCPLRGNVSFSLGRASRLLAYASCSTYREPEFPLGRLRGCSFAPRLCCSFQFALLVRRSCNAIVPWLLNNGCLNPPLPYSTSFSLPSTTDSGTCFEQLQCQTRGWIRFLPITFVIALFDKRPIDFHLGR